MMKLEVCASSINSVLEAIKGGATRVELCDNLHDGGTTPPLSWIEESIKLSDIQTFALIRPRGGDFLYNEREFYSMKRDIYHCGEAGCQGVVIGMLTEDGKVDVERMAELIGLAKSYKMSVTFHRAIDRSENIMDAMECAIALGCDRILTSGGNSTALKGKEVLKEMIAESEERIIIMPAGGINEENVVELVDGLDVKEFHGSFREIVKTKMKYVKEGVDSYENDYTTMVSSAEKIKKTLERVNKV